MNRPPRILIIVSAVLALCTIAASFVGGRLPNGEARTLLGAAAAFCGLMLLVPWIFTAGPVGMARDQAQTAAAGALGGLCWALYAYPETGWLGAFVGVAFGGFCGVLGYWSYRVREWAVDRVVPRRPARRDP